MIDEYLESFLKNHILLSDLLKRKTLNLIRVLYFSYFSDSQVELQVPSEAGVEYCSIFSL